MHIRRGERLSKIRTLWITLLISVPIVPKIKAVAVGDIPILMEDFIMVAAILIGVGDFLARASISGDGKVGVPNVAVLMLSLVFFKVIDLGLLALFVPWVGPGGLGRGIMVQEGVLVLGRMLSFAVVFMLALNSLRHVQSIIFVLRCFVFTVVVVVLIAFGQFFVLGHRALTSTFRNIHALTSVSDGWGTPDPWFDALAVGHEQLGAFMVLGASILVGLLCFGRPIGKGRRTLVAVVLASCMFTLIYAASRGAWIGALLSLGGFLWLGAKRGKNVRLYFGIGASLFFVAFIEWCFELGIVHLIHSRVGNLPSVFSEEITDDSAKLRLTVFSMLWGIFEANFLVGLGPGGAGRIAEGQYIRELVEGGLIGGMLFISLLWIIARNALNVFRDSRDPLIQGISLGFFCGIVGLGGQMFFTELLVLTKISVPFWILAAVVYRLGQLERTKHGIGPQIRPAVQ